MGTTGLEYTDRAALKFYLTLVTFKMRIDYRTQKVCVVVESVFYNHSAVLPFLLFQDESSLQL